ncbi:hypothetical protein [Streptomyces sp. MST-110588]|uniref:hypothetical protein n=1 Tax=Streptomyces sp. MST-110588 TaxID=2833628 RepID=UPI001F5C42BA|nr:hypothetical protein [Streptomyces sp. MST-110588]UNO41827.1 hypothetical protein KGS77_22630 [Streptomyces sp. MST-110588]
MPHPARTEVVRRLLERTARTEAGRVSWKAAGKCRACVAEALAWLRREGAGEPGPVPPGEAGTPTLGGAGRERWR